MQYKVFARRLAKLTNTSEETVRNLFLHMPTVLMTCKIDDEIRTPLGTFMIYRRRRKDVRTPEGKWCFAPERVQVRLRPSNRLHRDLEPSECAPMSAPAPSLPETEPSQPL